MRVGVVGGSASMNHALPEGAKAWPELLAEQIGNPFAN